MTGKRYTVDGAVSRHGTALGDERLLPRRHGTSRDMKKVSLITDGSCLGNPGPGGWACLLRFGGVKKEFFGFDPHTTNNRMELMAPTAGAQRTMRGRDHDRLRVCTLRDHEVDHQVEAEELVAEACAGA